MATNCTSKWRIIYTVIDIAIVGCVGLGALLVHQLASPYKRGFYCNDDSIKYPFHESTIPSSVLYSVGFLLNFIAFLSIEGIYVHRRRNDAVQRSKTSENSEHQLVSQATDNRKPKPSFILEYVQAVYAVLLPFLFGSAIEFLLRDIAKFSIGRLRPHFISICQPDFTKITCSDGYIENFVCQGDNMHLIAEGRLSFPSGHSSFSVYSMAYLILYVQVRIRWRGARLLRPWIQLLFFLMAFYTCISRVFDYKHHWSDVLAGAILGLTVCLLMVFKVSTLFTRENRTHQPFSRKSDNRVPLDSIAKCIPV